MYDLIHELNLIPCTSLWAKPEVKQGIRFISWIKSHHKWLPLVNVTCYLEQMGAKRDWKHEGVEKCWLLQFLDFHMSKKQQTRSATICDGQNNKPFSNVSDVVEMTPSFFLVWTSVRLGFCLPKNKQRNKHKKKQRNKHKKKKTKTNKQTKKPRQIKTKIPKDVNRANCRIHETRDRFTGRNLFVVCPSSRRSFIKHLLRTDSKGSLVGNEKVTGDLPSSDESFAWQGCSTQLTIFPQWIQILSLD